MVFLTSPLLLSVPEDVSVFDDVSSIWLSVSEDISAVVVLRFVIAFTSTRPQPHRNSTPAAERIAAVMSLFNFVTPVCQVRTGTVYVFYYFYYNYTLFPDKNQSFFIW